MSDIQGLPPVDSSYYMTGSDTAIKVDSKITDLLTHNPISDTVNKFKAEETNLKSAGNDLAALFKF